MFAIPSLKDLMERSRQSFRANLKGTDAWIWPNNIYASAKVMAGLAFELFGFADYIQRQKFATTADSENLDLHGDELGITRRPAAPAQGFVKVVVASGGFSANAGAIFRRSDLIEYRAKFGGSIPGAGNLLLEVVATTDGKASIADGGMPLEIVSGTTGSGLAEVGPDGITGGFDVEDDETFRGRILFRKRNPPHGGSAADYVLWASEVAGVSADAEGIPRVFVERLYAGPGTVRVFVMMDDLYADGIPQTADVLRVHDHIEGLRPAGAYVSVAAPVAVPIDIEVTDLKPDTPAVREAVLTELKAMFRRRSRVAGDDTEHAGMPFLATPTSFSRSWIWQAVANASGESRHKITAPAADTALIAGQVATLGAVSFVTD